MFCGAEAVGELSVGDRTGWQVKTKHTRGTVNKRGVVGQKVKPENDVMGACIEYGEHDRNVMVTNTNPSSAQTFDGGRTAVGDSDDRRWGRCQDLTKAAAKFGTHYRYTGTGIY